MYVVYHIIIAIYFTKKYFLKILEHFFKTCQKYSLFE